MARIIQEHFKDTQGKEAGLPVIARIFLVSGIVACLGSIVLTILNASFLWLGLGITVLILGIVCYVLFGAIGEIIVLLKRLSGLPAKGMVSGMKEGTISICSECGSLVYPDNLKCTSCGIDFESGEASGDEKP
jgi:hypothetical protein